MKDMTQKVPPADNRVHPRATCGLKNCPNQAYKGAMEMKFRVEPTLAMLS